MRLITTLRPSNRVKNGRRPTHTIETTVPEAGVKKTLSITPYDPELWLAFALLQAQRDPAIRP